jgi:SAM-dependent methyltransferase
MPTDRDRCCICGGGEFDLLHTQRFLLPGDDRLQYDVSLCRRCGFAWARNIPSPEEYERYYSQNRKYAYEGSDNADPSLEKTHGDAFRMVDGYLASLSPPPATVRSVLDVGCSTGSLLSFFHRAGYENILGLDPSPVSRDLAVRLYGVPVEIGSLYSFQPKTPFDVVILSSVLEHLPDLDDALSAMRRLIRPGGVVFIQVPDADSFGADDREPFLEFSIEHINYFNARSLESLLGRFGFRPLEIRQELLRFNDVSYPALSSLWANDGAPRPWSGEVSDPVALRAYVAQSRERLDLLSRRIQSMSETQERVVVWGVGSLTARLLADGNLASLNIVRFVDSNTSHHGKRLNGVEIRSPETLRGERQTVFVSTFVYGSAIRRILEEDYRYQGRIVSL